MKASELRIGNWFKNLRRNKEVTAGYNTFYFLSEGPLEEDDIQPIPLTEEWLLKFGFEDDSYAVFRKVIDKGISISVSFQDYAHTMLCDHPVTIWPNDYSIPIKCQYVHQLQNLYFALTGEELEVK